MSVPGWDEFESIAGPVLAQELALQAPVGGPLDPESGTLAASMTWRDTNDVLEIGSTDTRAAEYGNLPRLVVRGTEPHPIDPTGPWMLHFIASDGTEVFTPHVEHPGTKPNPFNTDAWETQRDSVLDAFRKTCPHAALQLLNPWRNRTI